MIYLREEHRARFAKEASIDDFFTIPGEVIKNLHRRKTLKFHRDGHGFYLKCHEGVGWREVFKNLLSLKLPVLGAQTEWRAIQRLHQLKVPTITAAGYGVAGLNPVQRRSFLLTEDLGNHVSLEKYCADWRARPPTFPLKRALIHQVADIARTLHHHGLNHRDFYLCHFLLSVHGGPDAGNIEPPRLSLVDLHRMQIRRRTPERWIIRDLAALYFSAMDTGLTQRDLLRFVRRYRGRPIRQIVREEAVFWRKVGSRAGRLYRSIWKLSPP